MVKLDLKKIKKISGDIILDEEGRWFHDGVEVTHKRTVEFLFRSIIAKENRYFLKSEKVPVPITVKGAPYFVEKINKKTGNYVLSLSDRTEEEFDPTTFISVEERPYCFVKKGMLACFLRKAYYDLMKDLQSYKGYLGLKKNGVFYPWQRQEKKNPKKVAKKNVIKKKLSPRNKKRRYAK